MITDFVDEFTRMLHAHAHCKTFCLHLDAVTLQHLVNVFRAVSCGKNDGGSWDFVAVGCDYGVYFAVNYTQIVHPR